MRQHPGLCNNALLLSTEKHKAEVSTLFPYPPRPNTQILGFEMIVLGNLPGRQHLPHQDDRDCVNRSILCPSDLCLQTTAVSYSAACF